MSTLIEDVTALLTTLAPSGGVHYGNNDAQPAAYPYIVWQRIVSTPNVTLDGPSDLQNTRIQVDVFSDRISQASALGTSVEALFAAWSVQNVPESSQDLYEAAIKAHRVTLDFSVWAKN